MAAIATVAELRLIQYKKMFVCQNSKKGFLCTFQNVVLFIIRGENEARKTCNLIYLFYVWTRLLYNLCEG